MWFTVCLNRRRNLLYQLHSSPLLERSCLKSCMLGFSIMKTQNFQMSKLGLKREEELEIKLPTFTRSQRRQGNCRKTSTSVSLTMLKPFTVWISRNWGTFIKRWELSRTCYQSLSNMYRGQKATETSLEKLTGSKFVNEYNNAVYCHLAYLIYMQSAC